MLASSLVYMMCQVPILHGERSWKDQGRYLVTSNCKIFVEGKWTNQEFLLEHIKIGFGGFSIQIW